MWHGSWLQEKKGNKPFVPIFHFSCVVMIVMFCRVLFISSPNCEKTKLKFTVFFLSPKHVIPNHSWEWLAGSFEFPEKKSILEST